MKMICKLLAGVLLFTNAVVT